MPDSSTGGVEVELRRDLGLFDVTMIGIGAMIGAGIFVLTGYAIESAGPAALIVFLLNGLVATLTALTYMELGSCFPRAGGSYLWVREGMPHPFGFLSGWMDWMAHTVACSLYALGFGSYLTWAFEANDVTFYFIPYDVVAKLFAVLVALSLLTVNMMGTGTTGKTENIVTVAKIIILTVFIGFGIYAMVHNPWAIDNFTKDFLPNGFGGIAYAMGLTFIAFQGFEVITQCSEEVKEPRKNIPKAILISLIVVIIIYLAIIIMSIGAVNGEEPGTSWVVIGSHGELAMVEAAKSFMGPIGFIIMIVGGLVSTISALNATVFSSSRVSFAMGRDGTLPKSLGKINPKRRTPSNAILLTGVILIVMVIALPIEDVAASAGLMFLLLFSFANISLITLRRKMPYLQRGFVVPLVPVVPLVATGLNIALAIYLFQHSPVSGYVAIVWIEFGLIGYYFTRGKEEISDLEKIEKMVGAPRRETGKKYHVLVPIANPKNTELIDIASTIAKHRDGDMILLNIAAIPDTIPIQNVDYDFVNKRVKIAENLSEYSFTKHKVPTRARVVVSHKIRDTILETVNKEKANFTIIGWSGKPPQPRIMFGYNIDDIIQFAHSDVAILKGPIKGMIKTILAYPGYGDHADRAVEVSAYIAKEYGAKVTIVGLISPSKSEAVVKQETNRLAEIVRSYGVYAEEKVIRTKHPVGKLDSISKDYDLVVMGADEKWKLLRYAFGPIQDNLSKRVTKPLLLVRAIGEEEELISTSDMGEGKAELTPTPRPVREPVGVAQPVDDMGEPEDENPVEGEAAEEGDDTEVPHASITPSSVLELDAYDKEPEAENEDDIAGADMKTDPESSTGTDIPGSEPAEGPGGPGGPENTKLEDSAENQPVEDENKPETPADNDKILNGEPSIPEEMEDEDGTEEAEAELDAPEELLPTIENEGTDGGDRHD